jgi:hypothetical protein
MGWIKNKQLPPVGWGEVTPPAIFNRLYQPLGKIVVTFADLEEQVTAALTTMLKTSWREGAAMESLMQNFSMRIELFYFLAMNLTQAQNQLAILARSEGAKAMKERQRQRAMEALQASAQAIFKDLKQANSDRNNLLHGAWTGVEKDWSAYSKHRVQAQDGKLIEIPVKGITVELLREEARFIISLNMRVADWTARFRRRDLPHLWPRPLPDRYLLRSPLGRLIQAHRNAAKTPQPRASRQSQKSPDP